MSNSVRPHRQQPTRLPGPWDSPGKNTGVGCHFLLQCTQVKSESKVSGSVVSDSSRPHGLQPNRLLRPWDFPSKSTGVGCHCTGIGRCMCAQSLQSRPTPCHPMDCIPPGSPVHGVLQAKILERVAMPSSRGSSQGDRTCVS